MTGVTTQSGDQRKNVKSFNSKQCREESPGTTSKPEGSDGVVTLVQRTDAVLRGLCLLLEHHNASAEIIEQLKIQLHSLLDNSGCETVWLGRIKYVLTYPLAKYLRNELPPKPDVEFRPSGALRDWMKERLNARNTSNYHLWCSWLQAKRATLPLSEDIVDQTYDKHLATLTKIDPGCDETIRKIFKNPTFVKVLDELRNAVTKAYSESSSFEEWMPSNNACFETSRSMGGQQGELAKLVGLRQDYDFSLQVLEDGWTRHVEIDKGWESVNPLAPSEFFSIEYRPWVYTRNGIRNNFHQERRFQYGHEEWSQLREAASLIDLSKPLNCTIQAVLEPNKVRVISKGNALPYYSCRPLQKALHSSMRTLAPFRLIGQPFQADDLVPLQEKASTLDSWFSVDYSAATDGLSWKYSGAILRYLIEGLPNHIKEMANAVLGPHALYYPVKGGRAGKVLRGVMQNGQLMGSILSFPILCLANFGVYCLATQERHFCEDWSFEERLSHVLINGDDMVYSDLPENWGGLVDIARKVGLEMSVGKAYVHNEYANINSTSVILPLHREGKLRCPREIKYLNVGLFFGQHKVQGKKEMELASHHTKASDGLVVNLNTILAGSKPGKEADLLRKFLAFHGNKIKDECQVRTYRGNRFVRNLFIPISLGGMGVVPPVGWKYFITKQELYVANGYINLIPDCLYTSQRPLPGYPLEEKLDSEVNVPWVTPKGELDETRVPLHKISFPRLRKLCRTGMVRYVPFKLAALAVDIIRKEVFKAPDLGDLEWI